MRDLEKYEGRVRSTSSFQERHWNKDEELPLAPHHYHEKERKKKGQRSRMEVKRRTEVQRKISQRTMRRLWGGWAIGKESNPLTTTEESQNSQEVSAHATEEGTRVQREEPQPLLLCLTD